MMKRVVLCVFVVGLLAFSGMAKIYYMPHIHTADNSWETYLLLSNSSPTDVARCVVNLYDEEGALVMTFHPSLDPGETITYSLRSYGGVTGSVSAPPDFVSARVGFVASESSGGGTAEFNLPDKLYRAAVLNLSAYYDELTWSGFAVFNGTDEDVTVTPRYFTTDGLSHTGTAFTLGAMEKRVDYFENQLGVPFADLTSVIFETDSSALAAIVISGNENEKLLFTNSGESRDAWEVVDRYIPTSGAGFATYYPVGQVTTPDYVLYAVSSSVGYGFSNLVKCFDRTNGNLVWQTDLASGMAGRGLAVSASGDYVYYYGTIPEAGNTNYQVYCLNAHSGGLVTGHYYPNAGQFPSEESIRNQIHVASVVDTVVVVYQAPDGVHRHLYDEPMWTESSAHTWAGLETVVTELGASGSSYLMLRTDWNAADSVYNQMVLWAFPYNNLAGGGIFEEVTDVRHNGELNHVFGDGLYVEGQTVHLVIKVTAGGTVGGDLDSLYASVADLYASYFDLSDNSLHLFVRFNDRSTVVDSSASTFMGPDGEIYMAVSGWNRSCILQPYFTQSRGYNYTFGNLYCEGDSLYMVSFYVELGALNGSTADHVVRVRKIPFTEFFCKGLQ